MDWVLNEKKKKGYISTVENQVYLLPYKKFDSYLVLV